MGLSSLPSAPLSPEPSCSLPNPNTSTTFTPTTSNSASAGRLTAALSLFLAIPPEVLLYNILARTTAVDVANLGSASKQLRVLLDAICDSYWRFRCRPYSSLDSSLVPAIYSSWRECYRDLSFSLSFGPSSYPSLPTSSAASVSPRAAEALRIQEFSKSLWRTVHAPIPLDLALLCMHATAATLSSTPSDDSSTPSPAGITVDAWFRCDTSGSRPGGIILGCQSGPLQGAASRWRYHNRQILAVTPTGHLRASFYACNAWTEAPLQSPARVDDGRWHHVALVLTFPRPTLGSGSGGGDGDGVGDAGAVQTLFVDGARAASQASLPPLRMSELTWLLSAQVGSGIVADGGSGGGATAGPVPFCGSVLDFRAWRRPFDDRSIGDLIELKTGKEGLVTSNLLTKWNKRLLVNEGKAPLRWVCGLLPLEEARFQI